MLDEFLAAIERLDLTPDEVAEAVWLARFVPERPMAQAELGSRPASPRRAATPTPPRTAPGATDMEPDGETETRASLLVPRIDTDARRGGATAVRVPAVPAIQNSSALLRALRPLRRLTDPIGREIVDEPATAVDVAETGVWLPHLTRQVERRFDLAIVVDASAAVGVWRGTVEALRILFARLGAFRDVRTWTLDLAPALGRLVLREGVGDDALPRDPAELIDACGHRVILLLSDCVGQPWQSGVIAHPLSRWARAGPVALIQTLPRRLWSRCAASFTPVRLSRTGPGRANADLAVQPRGGQAPDVLAGLGHPVPVLELTPQSLACWAGLVAEPPHQKVDSIILGTGRVARTTTATAHPYSVTSAESLVGHFRAGAIPDAYLLARYLAAVPLTMPVMQLVQRAMLPESSPSDLAEVFLSGLLWRPTPTMAASREDIEYDFRPGVRELLLSSLPRTETLRVLHAVSDLIASRMGPHHDFRAILAADPDKFSARELSPTFATVTATVLRSLGGRYADLAERLTPPAVDAPPEGGIMQSTHVPSGTLRRPPVVFEGVPPRNVYFTGRERLLQELRGGFVASGRVPCALFGLGGVGKTQLAVEYCYRYQHDYELIWWLPAEQRSRLRASIAELARHLNIGEQEDQSQTVAAVLDALRRGEPFKKWLLILDNAADPDQVQEYFRYSVGHVLVTSRNRTWAGTDTANALEVDVFSRDESIQLLRRRVETNTEQDAARLAERLGDLPMALEQAAAYQLVLGISIEDYLRLLDENPQAVLGEGTAPGYDNSVQVTFRVAHDRLREQSLAAAQLLELTAFFGAEPISRRVLMAGGGVDLPEPLASAVGDDLQLIQVIGEIARLSLARLDSRRGTIQVHRLLKELIRSTLSRDLRSVNRRYVQEILSRANPGEPDNTRSWDEYGEIAPHVAAARCVDGATERIRKVVLDQVRFHYATGDYPGSWELGEPALKNWRNRLGEDALETLILARHLGNTLRALGRNAEARRLNESTWERLHKVYGPLNVHTLVMVNSFGADLRISGEYQRAYELDRENLEQIRSVFGHDTEEAVRSTNNYGVDLRLLGGFQQALAVDEANLDLSRNVLGPEQPYTHLVNGNVALDRYGIGDYTTAVELLDELLPRFAHRVGPDHSNVLRVTRTYAAALRMVGRPEDARAQLTRILRTYRVKFGESHIDTIAATTTMANVLLALGEFRSALARAESALASYKTVLGPRHPFALGAAINLAVILRADGQYVAARALDEETLAGLRTALGEDHPFALRAMAGVASNHSLAGEHAAAVRLSAEVYSRSRSVLGEEHPATHGAALNYALDLRAIGDDDRADELFAPAVAGLARVFGEGHAEVRAALDGHRSEFDIEAPPI